MEKQLVIIVSILKESPQERFCKKFNFLIKNMEKQLVIIVSILKESPQERFCV